MSFTGTSTDFWLEDGHILHAQCQDENGEWNGSSLDLNEYVGNSDGWFIWNGESKCCSTIHHVQEFFELLTRRVL